MDDRTFTVVGVSTKDGLVKVRWANDLEPRIKRLEKLGNTNVKLFEIPIPMSKVDATRWLNNKMQDLSALEMEAVLIKSAEKMREYRNKYN
jgi:hypothetical protein